MTPLKKFVYQYVIPCIGRIFKNRNRFVNVIYYHDVVKGKGETYTYTNIKVFKRQMDYIAKNGYETVRFDDLDSDESLSFRKKKVLIAFDDGWLSNFTEIYDYMKATGLKYNIFLAVKEIGANPNYLTWDQIRLMHGEGVVGFGVHTYNHSDISDISKIDPSVEFELADSVFTQELGYEPKDFCYPYGSYSDASNKYIEKNAQYYRIYTSSMMYSYEQNKKIIFGRNGISDNDSFGVFKGKLKGYYNVWKTFIK